MKHLFYITLLTREGYIITLMSREEKEIRNYIECTVGNQINAFFKGGNKFNRTGILCSPHDPEARHLPGMLLDIAMVSTDTDETVVIQPLNQED